jgi:hypothetical protein
MAAAAEAALAAPVRHAVTLPDGRPVYEWAQSLSEVDLFIPGPPAAPGSAYEVVLTPDRVRVGLKGNPPYLDVRFFGGRACVGGTGRAESQGREPGVFFVCFLMRETQRHSDTSPCLPPSFFIPQHALGARIKASESYWTVGECGEEGCVRRAKSQCRALVRK